MTIHQLEDYSANIDPIGSRISSQNTALKNEYNETTFDRERAFLQKLGFSKPFLKILAKRAAENGTTLEAELLADRSVEEESYYAAFAKALNLPFVSEIDASTTSDNPDIDMQLVRPRSLRCHLADGMPALAIVPSASEMLSDDASIASWDDRRIRMVVTTPSALRNAVWQTGSARRVDAAANGLFDNTPEFSARTVMTGSQGFMAGLGIMTVGVVVTMVPTISMMAIHVFLSCCYFLSLLFRGVAIKLGPWLTRPKPLDPVTSELPVYTVLVAVYKESGMARQLVDRLNELKWPRSKLDIKLVCEADDLETIAAFEALDLAPEYEIVRVPPMKPRTKPKALNYGLAAARGDYLVIYDAEDRPHPEQLLEAYQTFQKSKDNVACLQAPLIVSNIGEGWLPALFGLEYAALFRRLLPLLGALRLPMPLGGTSNHFRVEALKSAGGWDAFNVTEDADLGMRLFRRGYRSGVITRWTLEDAPTEARVWLGQRRRWFKGWMQTWLVAMRRPVDLTRELGIGGTLAFHGFTTLMLISALAHPLLFVFLATSIWNLTHALYTTTDDTLLLLDAVNTFGSYLLFVLMGQQAMRSEERRRLGFKWCWSPVYWMMISYVAWRALIELYTKPFYWSKTPHTPSKKLNG